MRGSTLPRVKKLLLEKALTTRFPSRLLSNTKGTWFFPTQ